MLITNCSVCTRKMLAQEHSSQVRIVVVSGDYYICGTCAAPLTRFLRTRKLVT